MWSGLIENGRTYSPFTYNVEAHGSLANADRTTVVLSRSSGVHRLRRTSADLQAEAAADAVRRPAVHRKRDGIGPTIMLNFLTPHGKWHIHSTYGDNQRMTTLSRGIYPLWMNDQGRGVAGDRRQRLGGSLQRQRCRRDASGCQFANSAGNLHAVPRTGTNASGFRCRRCARTVERVVTTA